MLEEKKDYIEASDIGQKVDGDAEGLYRLYVTKVTIYKNWSRGYGEKGALIRSAGPGNT